MKVGIQTWGSLGDIRPFMALASGLQTAGHEVTLVCTCVGSEPPFNLIAQSGVKCISIASSVFTDQKELKAVGAAIVRETNPIAQIALVIEKLFLPDESAMYQAAEQLCEENDVVIGHYFHYPLVAAAQRYERRYVSIALVHSAVPSAFQPPAGVPNLGILGNRLAWWIAKFVLNMTLKKYPDRLHAKLGIRKARDLMANVWASDQLTLVAVSPSICKSYSDWPSHYQVCGFLNLPNGALESDTPEALKVFLSRGDAPVYMTFGSAILGADIKATISILCKASELASARCIIQVPGLDQFDFRSTDKIHYIESSPHAMVFPLCCAIIHHGGAGTSQSALLAGKPSIVVAHTAEQEFWGQQLEMLGVAHKSLLRRRLTSETLAAAIQQVIGSRNICAAAKKIGAKMVTEDGVAKAVKLITEKFLI